MSFEARERYPALQENNPLQVTPAVMQASAPGGVMPCVRVSHCMSDRRMQPTASHKMTFSLTYDSVPEEARALFAISLLTSLGSILGSDTWTLGVLP